MSPTGGKRASCFAHSPRRDTWVANLLPRDEGLKADADHRKGDNRGELSQELVSPLPGPKLRWSSKLGGEEIPDRFWSLSWFISRIPNNAALFVNCVLGWGMKAKWMIQCFVCLNMSTLGSSRWSCPPEPLDPLDPRWPGRCSGWKGEDSEVLHTWLGGRDEVSTPTREKVRESEQRVTNRAGFEFLQPWTQSWLLLLHPSLGQWMRGRCSVLECLLDLNLTLWHLS